MAPFTTGHNDVAKMFLTAYVYHVLNDMRLRMSLICVWGGKNNDFGYGVNKKNNSKYLSKIIVFCDVCTLISVQTQITDIYGELQKFNKCTDPNKVYRLEFFIKINR